MTSSSSAGSRKTTSPSWSRTSARRAEGTAPSSGGSSPRRFPRLPRCIRRRAACRLGAASRPERAHARRDRRIVHFDRQRRRLPRRRQRDLRLDGRRASHRRRDRSERASTSAHNCFQLVLDPNVALAAYVSHFFNSERGRTLRRAWSGGATIQRIPRAGLDTRTIYLPDVGRQAEMVRLSDAARSTRARLAQLDVGLWETPQDLAVLRDEIRLHRRRRPLDRGVALPARFDSRSLPRRPPATRQVGAPDALLRGARCIHRDASALAPSTGTTEPSSTYRPGWAEIRSLRKARVSAVGSRSTQRSPRPSASSSGTPRRAAGARPLPDHPPAALSR